MTNEQTHLEDPKWDPDQTAIDDYNEEDDEDG